MKAIREGGEKESENGWMHGWMDGKSEIVQGGERRGAGLGIFAVAAFDSTAQTCIYIQ